MKSFLSVEKTADLDKLRILNNKISKIMLKNSEGVEVLNEVLFLSYVLTLKDMVFGIKRFLLKRELDSNLLKWIDDLVFTVMRQKSINKFLKEKQPVLLKSFEQMIIIAHRVNEKIEDLIEIIEDENFEKETNQALNYFVSLHYKKKHKSKKTFEEAHEVNIID